MASVSLIKRSESTSSVTNASKDDHVIQLWLRSKSDNSKDAYIRDVQQFVSFCEIELPEVKIEHIWSWLDDLNARSYAVSTCARKLASVKSLFSFGHRVGYLTFNVGAAISLPKIPDLLAQRILSESEIASILATSNTLRDSVLLKLFYASGARVSELSGLTWERLQERPIANSSPEGQITLVGKGSQARNVIVSKSVWSSLQDLLDHERTVKRGDPTDPVFRSLKGGALSRQQMWRIVKKSVAKAGIRKSVSPHWLRHAHASHSLDRGAPTHLVKETLGHKSLLTTSRYTHARPDDSSGKYLDV